MKNESDSPWNRSRGDGSTQPLGAEKFTALKAEFEQLAKDAGESVNDRRQIAEDTRFCRWAGQSTDGKKRAAAMENGVKPFPFEGASDARVRTADGITQEQVVILMAALMRMQLGVRGTEGTDMELAADINVLWRWIQNNQLGAEWFVEMSKLAQYRQGDSPAVGIMQVNWHEEKTLNPVTIMPEEVAQRVIADLQARGDAFGPGDGEDLQDMLANPDRAGELSALLGALWPDLSESAAMQAAKALQETGEATFAYPFVTSNRLRLKARRLFEDIFVPENTTDLQRARVVFVREWFTEPELREMDAKGEFKPGFMNEVLKHEGETGWTHYCHTDTYGDYSESLVARTKDKSQQRGQYELITAFFRSSNSIGLPGIYTVQFHTEVENPGTDMQLFDSPKGRLPFFANPREILTDKLWDSRGIPELAMTEQASLKQLHDSFMDHVQLTTVPPLEVPANRPKLGLVIRPLGMVKSTRPGDIKPLDLGKYPLGNDKVQNSIEDRLARYFAQMREKVMPDWVRLYQQHLIDSFFVGVAEVVRYGLALAWDYLPDETLARVLGHPLQRDMGQLDYDVHVSFEAGMLNMEFLSKVGEMITNYALSWDTMSTIQRDKLVRWFFSALSPSLAQELLVPVETANQREVEDEQNIFSMISAGVEPPMILEGQNFQLRLQTQMQIGQKNPEAWEKLTPKSREILEARINFLEQQVVQQQNAQIGRTGARPALEPEPAAAAVSGGMPQ